MSKLLRKKDFDYFGYFCTIASSATEAANYLHQSLSDFDRETFPAKMDAMHQIENTADMNRHEMTKQLAHEFITPIEREDIISMAQELDTVVDTIDDLMRRVYMYNVKEIRPEMLEFTALIIKCCSVMAEAVGEFKHFKNSKTIVEKIVAVNALESEGDALHARCIHNLFSEEADTRDTMVWMTIFEGSEMCLDACEDVVDIIESVIMKNT